MVMLRTLSLTLVLLAGCVFPLAAQQGAPPPVEVDSLARVRLRQSATDPRTLTGRLLFADSQTLTVEHRGRPQAVPLPAVERLEVSIGRYSTGEGAWRGAKAGFFGGAVVSALLIVTGVVSDAQGDCGDCFITATGAAVLLSVPLTTFTTVGGTLIGAVAPGERWAPVTTPVRLRPAAPER
jgi:hypothetical protein